MTFEDAPFMGYKCPIAGVGKHPSDWPYCIGEKCAWFDEMNSACAVLSIGIEVHNK